MKLQLDSLPLPALVLGLAVFAASPTTALADTIIVQQVMTTFVPADIIINEGDTVQWNWTGGVHTVTEGTDGIINGNEAFHSDLNAATTTFSVTFDAAFLAANPMPNDTYDYFCEPHIFQFNMVGTIQVCAPAPVTYCTSKATSIPGCTPSIGFAGTPSLAAGALFNVTAGPVPGNNPGLFIYTTNGAAGSPISNSFGFLCIAPGSGLFRIAFQNGGGTTGVCNGQYSVDFVDHALTQAQDAALVVGAEVDIQCWYRDPPNVGTANLTNAGRFTLCQ